MSVPRKILPRPPTHPITSLKIFELVPQPGKDAESRVDENHNEAQTCLLDLVPFVALFSLSQTDADDGEHADEVLGDKQDSNEGKPEVSEVLFRGFFFNCPHRPRHPLQARRSHR